MGSQTLASNPGKAHNRAYAVLVFLLLLSGANWFDGAIAAVDQLRHGQERVRLPLEFGFRMQVVSGITREAFQAGVRIGDTLLEFDGQPFTGLDVMRHSIRQARPGAVVPIRIRRAAGGEEATLAIRLAPEIAEPAGISAWFRTLAIQVLFPLFCLCLGFWVAAARPHDRNAWLLLAIMISLEFLTPTGDWGDPWLELTVFWRQLCGSTWAIWMMLFGVYFPERARLDRRFPWIKWLLIVLIAVPSAFTISFQAGKEFSFSSVAWLRPALFPLDTVARIASMCAIGIFFMLLGHKTGTASTPDARRRLRLLLLGAVAGFTPSFIISVISLFTGADFEYSVPVWSFYFAMGCLAIFPVTLAYVILVQRAMEVRMVIRQSAQYALARGALWLLRGLVLSIAIYIFLNVRQHEFHPLTEAALIGLAILLLIFRRRFTGRFSRWMDKRFFREAYSTEQILSDLSNEARRFVEIRPLLETVTRRISETLHVPRIAVLLRQADGFHLEPSWNGESPDAAPESTIDLSPESRAVQVLSASHQPAVIYFDDPDSWFHKASAAEQQALRDLDVQVLLPLSGRDELLGVMALGPKRSEEPYSKADLRLLQSVASQTGLAIENGRLLLTLADEAARRERLHRELEIAREVQERLFPQSYPSTEGLDCAGFCRPASGVGGDYYDFIPLPDGRIGVAVGDISGKGIPAALLMASLRASLRVQTIGNPADLAMLVRNVNLLLYESSAASRYATFFYSQYDPASRRLDFVNAGHNPPFVLRGPEIIHLEASGPVVGLLPNATYEQQSLVLAPGDVLCAYTDGISEAMTIENEEWGEERMVLALEANIGMPAAAIIDRVIAAADRFAAGAPQHDDMTLVLMKVLT